MSVAAGGRTPLRDDELAERDGIWHRPETDASLLGTVLEIGARYGRIPLYLVNARRVTWTACCALDISETERPHDLVTDSFTVVGPGLLA